MAMIGQTGMKGLTAYSPWFDRGGSDATFLCQVIARGTAGDLNIDVEHKNYADTSEATAGSFPAMTAAGVSTVDITGLKEQVRFKYVVGGANNEDWMHFRMLNPAWRN